jgi:hypothetical protein
MNSEQFSKYEVLYWIFGFIIRRILVNTVYPTFGMSSYELSKDVSLLFAKILLANVIFPSRTDKENGQNSAPSTSIDITNKETKDGDPQN